MRPVARLIKSARNRSRLDLRHLRGGGLRVLSWLGVLQGGDSAEVGRAVALDLYGELTLGRGVILDDGCRLYVGPSARLVLGDGCYIGRGTVLAASQGIEIGAGTLIAEHCSIRDSDHRLSPARGRYQAPSECTPVRLGRDVWLGAGVRVLRGSVVGSGAVVAANSVVRGEVPPLTVVAGAPARQVKTLPAEPLPIEPK